jgi:hypothetical protein
MGGKSRKSGGVSKKLIQALKYGKNSCGKKSNEDKSTHRSIFETSRGAEDQSKFLFKSTIFGIE